MASFYDKKELLFKATKFYTSAKLYVDFMADGELFPLDIKLSRVKQSDLQNRYAEIKDALSSLQKERLNLIYKEFNFKSVGMQKLPTSLRFVDREALLHFIKKSDEFAKFETDSRSIIERFPRLKELVIAKPFLVVEYGDAWHRLLKVCEFFIQNKRANIYLRELGIEGIDTKFIERYKKIIDTLLSHLLDADSINSDIISLSNYGFEKKYYLKYPLPRVRFRILDATQTIAGLSDISIDIEEFKKLYPRCRDIFVVENKITTLSFPSLVNSMVIFGSGYGVEVLKDVEWLEDKNIYYWGDIDSDGFAILSLFRGYFSGVRSILMDETTIELFRDFSVTVEQRAKKELKNLTKDEEFIYRKIDFRLEQERIDFNYVKKSLTTLDGKLQR